MFDLRPEERISEWRHFRQSIQYLDRQDMLQKTATLWANAPLVNYYLDTDTCKDWPDPWTLISENMYCDVGVALGIFYTLFLTERFDNRDLEVVIYKNSSGFLPSVHVCEKYALNINYREVLNISTLPEELQVYRRFSAEDLLATDYL
jgi:hypothetical protein